MLLHLRRERQVSFIQLAALTPNQRLKDTTLQDTAQTIKRRLIRG